MHRDNNTRHISWQRKTHLMITKYYQAFRIWIRWWNRHQTDIINIFLYLFLFWRWITLKMHMLLLDFRFLANWGNISIGRFQLASWGHNSWQHCLWMHRSSLGSSCSTVHENAAGWGGVEVHCCQLQGEMAINFLIVLAHSMESTLFWNVHQTLFVCFDCRMFPGWVAGWE